MASSEQKRHQQSLKRHTRNQSVRSRIKTLTKKVTAAAKSGDAETAEAQLRTAVSALQKAGQKGVLHPNTAARHIGQLSRLVHRSKATTASA